MELLKILSRPVEGKFQVVDLQGEIDMSTCRELKRAIYGLIDAGQYDLVLNLTEVRYIDSTGLGLLLGAARRVREKQGGITLLCESPSTLKLFRITGLDRVFPVFPSEAEFRQSLGPSA